MKYTNQKLGIPGICLMLCALLSALAGVAAAQAFGTTTVQGTVYSANGAAVSGTLQLSWPAFTTAANQAVAAGRTTVSIGSSGFVSVNLAPNIGATPAGLYYTAIYHLSDGTTSTEYWVVPAAAQAALAQVRAQVMPAAQAVQAVNKAYVDQSIAQIAQGQVTSSGGNLTGPLYLNGDPTASTQAATKHYVDNQMSQTISISGGAATGPLTAVQLGAAYQADQFPGSDFGARLQACINALNGTYGGSCDARNFSGTLQMAANVTISKANVTINLPCATIATSSQFVVTAGTRNVTLHGCASRGTSVASGSQGGTVFMYSGNAAMIQVGDATYASDTLGFHLDNVVINTTSSMAATAQAVTVWRAQELHLEGLYLLGNANQTGITLDGTGNYTGGTFNDVEIGGFQTALNAIGHQAANAATTDWVNASTFVRLHIDCPTANGSAIAGTTGINLAQGDGNTFTGGDVEGCATALHLGANAQNNTIVGLRNENSTYQVVADAGSAFNNWITGGTMFTGKLTDNGTRNSFLDAFHRSFNGLNGDWYGSQQDATVTNHYRLGIGSGAERGLLQRYQTDSGYRWTMGLSDAAAGAQYYQVLDELNNVNRLSIGQTNAGQPGSNNQTVINGAGTGAVVLNGSNNAGSGGVVFGSGGPSSATVATINNAGNAQFNGTLQVSGASTFLNSTTLKNQADAEIDANLWAGSTAPQKESVVYKDFNGNSQWYLVKDASNNWALNSAVGGVDSFKAYQSNNSGDTYLDAANNAGVVRVNYEPGSGSAFNVYGGSSASLYASFNGAMGIKFPGLAAGSGHNCVQIDNTGYLSNTGTACGSNSVGIGTTGQFAYYAANGSTLSGMTSIPLASGGTGATSASGALASLGGLPLAGGTLSGPIAGSSATFSGNVQAQSVSLGSDQPTGSQAASANAAVTTYSVLAYGAKADAVQWMINGTGTYYISVSMTSGNATIVVSNYSFTSADVGKYVGVSGQSAQPFADLTFTPGQVWTTNNVAQIASVTDASHAVLNKPAANSFTGYITIGTDDVPGINLCATTANAKTGGGVCLFPPGRYFLATAPYYLLSGATDDGGYGIGSGGSGASITPVLGSGSTAGQIVSYTVNSGGGGYTANSALQVSISGGCNGAVACGQAFALANTNSSGAVTSVTGVYPGFGFVSTPTVAVLPLGGDGATATATLSGSTIGSISVTAGGSGYPASSSTAQSWYALQGASGCTAIGGTSAGFAPIVAKGTSTTNAAGQITSLTINTNATSCTSAPAIVFGDNGACNSGTSANPVWGQCTNVAPLNPTAFPVQIFMNSPTSWMGQSSSRGGGVNLYGAWDGKSVDQYQPAIFGGYFRYFDMDKLILNTAFLGVHANNNVNYAKISNVTFNTGIGMWTAATDIGSVFENLTFGGSASWINGGSWTHRTDFASGGGGFFDADSVKDLLGRPAAYGGAGSLQQKIDDYFNNFWWHSEYSANAADFLETCKFPQTANQRQTGPDMGAPQVANAACYPGITSMGPLEILTRDNRATGGAQINGIVAKQISRNVFCCDIGGLQITNIGCEACSGIPGTNDPYRNATQLEGTIKTIDIGQSSFGWKPFINGVNYSGSPSVNRSIWSISQQGDPVSTGWTANVGGSVTNAQPVSNPLFQNLIHFPQGLDIPVRPNFANGYPLSFYDYYNVGAQNVHTADVQSMINGLEILTGSGGALTDSLDITTSAVTAMQPFVAPSVTLNGGTQATGTVGTGGKLQETTSAPHTSGSPVAFNANGDTVNATAANIGGLFAGCSGAQYLGYDGSCHTAPITAAQVASLFTSCSGTQYLGADGACHMGGAGTITGVTAGYGVTGGGTTGTVSAAVSLTSASNFITADVPLTTANTLYDGPSVSLAAGTWFITSTITVVQANATIVECQIWNGTTIAATSNVSYGGTLTISGIVAPGSTTTYKTSCMGQATGQTMKAQTALNSGTNKASGIVALRIQ